MDTTKLRELVASLLLVELETGLDEWYYLSIVHVQTNTFVGGYLLVAKGPTDAWCKMHQLGWCPPDCETLTLGPIEPDVMEKVPEEKRWRKLSREEAESLGK